MDKDGEDALVTFKLGLVELLRDIRYLGLKSCKKTDTLIDKINNNSLDINNLENTAIGVLKVCKIMKENLQSFTNYLEDILKQVTLNRNEILFNNLISALHEYKSNVPIVSNNGCNFVQLSEQCTQTDVVNQSVRNSVQTQTEISELLNVEVKSETDNNDTNMQVTTLGELKSRTGFNLGLQETHTQDTDDTDDCWVDSIARSPTVIDLWNKEYIGEEINPTDEYLEKLKRELEEDDDPWDKETVDMNYDPDLALPSASNSDDSFVDGCASKDEKNKSQEGTDEAPTQLHEENVKAIEKESDIFSIKDDGTDAESSLKEESFITEEHRLPSPTSDTNTQNKIPLETDDGNTKEMNSSEHNKTLNEVDNAEQKLKSSETDPANTSEDKNLSKDKESAKSYVSEEDKFKGSSESDENVKLALAEEESSESSKLEISTYVQENANTDSMETVVCSPTPATPEEHVKIDDQTEKVDAVGCTSTETNLDVDNTAKCPEDQYTSPFSVETVIVHSDDESSNSQSSEDLEIDLSATQPINLEQPENNAVERTNENSPTENKTHVTSSQETIKEMSDMENEESGKSTESKDDIEELEKCLEQTISESFEAETEKRLDKVQTIEMPQDDLDKEKSQVQSPDSQNTEEINLDKVGNETDTDSQKTEELNVENVNEIVTGKDKNEGQQTDEELKNNGPNPENNETLESNNISNCSQNTDSTEIIESERDMNTTEVIDNLRSEVHSPDSESTEKLYSGHQATESEADSQATEDLDISFENREINTNRSRVSESEESMIFDIGSPYSQTTEKFSSDSHEEISEENKNMAESPEAVSSQVSKVNEDGGNIKPHETSRQLCGDDTDRDVATENNPKLDIAEPSHPPLDGINAGESLESNNSDIMSVLEADLQKVLDETSDQNCLGKINEGNVDSNLEKLVVENNTNSNETTLKEKKEDPQSALPEKTNQDDVVEIEDSDIEDGHQIEEYDSDNLNSAQNCEVTEIPESDVEEIEDTNPKSTNIKCAKVEKSTNKENYEIIEIDSDADISISDVDEVNDTANEPAKVSENVEQNAKVAPKPSEELYISDDENSIIPTSEVVEDSFHFSESENNLDIELSKDNKEGNVEVDGKLSSEVIDLEKDVSKEQTGSKQKENIVLQSGAKENSNTNNESLEFDISENLNNIDNSHGKEVPKQANENKKSGIKETQNARDIIEAVENLLYEDKDENEDKTDVTSVVIDVQEDEKKQSDQKTGDANGPVELIDSDDDNDNIVEVTMEEILSNASDEFDQLGYQEEIVEPEVCITEIKQEDNEQPASNEEDIAKNSEDLFSVSATQVVIGDQLLELFKEEKIKTTDKVSGKKEAAKVDPKEEAEEADKIFKMLQEESESDISDSDVSDEDINLELSDSLLLEEDPVKTKSQIERERESELFNRYKMVPCSINLEKLDLDGDESVKISKTVSDSVDRLCDISSLIKKRRCLLSLGLQEVSRPKKPKRTSRSKKGTSSNESDSDNTINDLDDVVCNETSILRTLTIPLQQHSSIVQNSEELIANAICNTLDCSSGESSDDESDVSNKSSKKTKETARNGENVDIEKPKLSKEEREKKAWKNDPLLRQRLADSDTASDTESSQQKRKKFKNRYQNDTDLQVISDSSSEDDSSARKQNALDFLEKVKVSPIKGNIPILDSDSDDADCEIVEKSPENPINDDEDDGPSSSQRGRRNIRALMSDENLAEATQMAHKEEQKRIARLEDRVKVRENLSQSFSQSLEEEESFVLDVDESMGTPLIKVHPKLNRRLKPHQRDGVQFLWDSCYESVEQLKNGNGSGCILAHCMGLGKTLQVLTLIHTLFTYDVTSTKHVLVVCPLSTVNNWKKEVKITFKDFEKEFSVLTIADKKDTAMKFDIVKKWKLRKKSVLVLGYEAFETLTNDAKLDKISVNLKERMLEALVDPGPDLVICDEGHLLRNKNALKTLALNKIRTTRRIVLTGTPMQNNLMEYYHMVQFVKPNLLGNFKEFKINFVNPISNGQYEDSTKEDIRLMHLRTHVLHELLKKTIQRVEDTELKIYLPRMVDHAVFIQLHQVQIDLYKTYTNICRNVNDTANKKGFLWDFTVFQYICTHPHLLSVVENMKNKKIKERDVITDEQEKDPQGKVEGWWKTIVPKDTAENILYGNKLVVLREILEECEEIGDKVLVFSKSLGELDLIEHFLNKVGTTKCPSWINKTDYYRMDGTVPPEIRTSICDLFNDSENKKNRLLLMSTKVGGLGLNLTAANRVIIMTVNWNPSFDMQSVFRVYRFGQTKEVYVYRLVSMDTMEEKVYQRTVTKLAIAHRVVDKHQITRHYKSIDLRELYSCTPNADEERPTPNVPEDKVLAKLILKFPFIFKYHEHKALLANRPEDNLNEQELNAAWDEFKKTKNTPVALPKAPPEKPYKNAPTYVDAYALSLSNENDAAPTRTDAAPTRTVTIGQEDWTRLVGAQKAGLPKIDVNSIDINQIKGDFLKKFRSKNDTLSNNPTTNPSTSQQSLVNLSADVMVINGDRASLPVDNSERDPLYIGETSTDELMYRRYFNVKMPNPKDASSNQKENSYQRAPIDLSKPTVPIIIEDDELKHLITKKTVLSDYVPKENTITHSNSARNNGKRKQRDTSSRGKEETPKKMRHDLNISNTQESITLDDDEDDVDKITDTTSDGGSISSDIIQNLKHSGISVYRVPKEQSGVIMLD